MCTTKYFVKVILSQLIANYVLADASSDVYTNSDAND